MTDLTPSEPVRLDFNRLTIGDMEDFETMTGQPFQETMEGVAANASASVPVKILKAIVFLCKRLDDPDFKMTDARKVRVSELVIDMGGAEPDPTAAAS